MSNPQTITIDLSGATAGIDLPNYLAQYYTGLSSSGASTYYGGTPDANPFGGGVTYQNGSQVGFRWTGDSSQRQVLLEGEEIAYDFIHHGSSFGHGISGRVDSITFGRYDAGTLPADGAGGHGELQGVIAEVVISGLGISAAPGSGNNAGNPVYAFYSQARLNGVTLGLDKNGMIAALDATFDGYAQTIIGSRFDDILDGGQHDDTIDGAGGDDTVDGGGGDDTYALSGTRAQYDITDNDDGSFTISDLRGASNEGVDTVSNVETFAFADGEVAAAQLEGDGQATITIDASGAVGGINFEAFIRGGFLSGTIGSDFPVFDNGSGFSGEEMFIGYGSTPASKYILAHGALAYAFGTHTVHGTINTIEYGTRGTGSFDADGYFVGGSAQLRITGLDLSNDASTRGVVHAFAAGNTHGAGYDPADLAAYADSLDAYGQNFIGSAGDDVFGGGALDDDIAGNGGDDLFYGSGGIDAFDGGADSDTVDFAGNKSGYTITETDDGLFLVVKDASGAEARLENVEFARFDDFAVNLDTGEEIVVGAAPTNVALSAASIRENTPAGRVVGRLSAVDPEGKAVTFSLESNPGDLFEIVGNQLRLKGGVDFEASETHAVTVRATDADGGATTQGFTISVLDVNEAPRDLTLSRTSVSENTEVGSRIGTLSAIDPDDGALTYTLRTNPGGLFAIDGNKLVLAANLDFEAGARRTIVVEAVDAGGLKTAERIVIAIKDVRETTAGTNGNDVLTGGNGMDRLTGGRGDDALNGRGGDDWLHGGVGADRIVGGLGADDLRGGEGADRFIVRSTAETSTAALGQDAIFDFSSADGDRIHLSSIDANAALADNQAFSFIGASAFGRQAGELRVEAVSGGVLVSGDIDGDAAADFAIRVEGVPGLSASDFVL